MAPTISLATGDDATAIASIYAPIVEETAISFETEAPTAGEMAERILGTTERLPWLVCEADGTVAGYAYASPHGDRPGYRWSVDVSVYVAEPWRRSGVARGLYESLFASLRLQGVFNAYAVIALPNPASVDLHESMGFERVGVYRKVGFKAGRWRDVGHWELVLMEHDPSPDSPRPVCDLRGTTAFEEAVARGEPTIEA